MKKRADISSQTDTDILRDRCAALEDALRDRDREIEYLKSDSVVVRGAADYFQEAIVVLSRDGRILYANNKSCELLGYKRSELHSLAFVDVLHPDFRLGLQDTLDERFSGKSELSQYETQLINSDEQSVYIELTAGIIDWEGEKADLVSMRDISERRIAEEERGKLELQLRQSQKMEAIGTLAGGIAHDFNNILGVITGYAGMGLMQDIPQDSPVKDFLNEILTTADRAKELIRQILAFSRKQDAERRTMDLTVLIKETLKMLRASMPSTIQFDVTTPGVPITVNADPTHLHQIIMNLCMNAAQSMMDTGGVVSISLAVKNTTDSDVRIFDLISSGRYAELVVRDTGTGIDKHVMQHLFEPYYSSRPLGKGTGLGLSVVKGLIREYKGGISVTSEEGEGTCVTVLIPEYAESEVSPRIARGKEVARGTGSVLFVDDEDRVVKMAKYMLKMIGYTVHAFNDSLDALEYFRFKPDETDILITDQTMPHMVGTHLAREILKIRPGLPVILCTGYQDKDLQQEIEEIGITKLIVKPISIEDLSEAIFGILNTSR